MLIYIQALQHMAEGLTHLAITGAAPPPDQPPGSPGAAATVVPAGGHDLALSDLQTRALTKVKAVIQEVSKAPPPIHRSLVSFKVGVT